MNKNKIHKKAPIEINKKKILIKLILKTLKILTQKMRVVGEKLVKDSIVWGIAHQIIYINKESSPKKKITDRRPEYPIFNRKLKCKYGFKY